MPEVNGDHCCFRLQAVVCSSLELGKVFILSLLFYTTSWIGRSEELQYQNVCS